MALPHPDMPNGLYPEIHPVGEATLLDKDYLTLETMYSR